MGSPGLETGKMDPPHNGERSQEGDEGKAIFQIAGKLNRVEGENAQVYVWATRVHLPSTWNLQDAAVATSTLIRDIADRNGWSRDEFIRAVMGDFVQTED